MAFGELGGVADVEDLRACVAQVQDIVEIDGMERLFEVPVEGGAFLGVENRVVGEVGRGVGLVGGYEGADEFFPCSSGGARN